MLTIGQRYFFKTYSHYYLGEVVALHATHVELKDVSEVYETGPLAAFFGDGKVKACERLPDGWCVPSSCAFGPWRHELPKKATGV